MKNMDTTDMFIIDFHSRKIFTSIQIWKELKNELSEDVTFFTRSNGYLPFDIFLRIFRSDLSVFRDLSDPNHLTSVLNKNQKQFHHE